MRLATRGVLGSVPRCFEGQLPVAEARSDRGETQIARVLFDGQRAVGVELADGERIEAGRVILSAGVLHTPLILWRSGIGPV